MSVEAITKDKLITDVKVVLTDAEELLKVTAASAGEKVQEARTRIEKNLLEARAKLGVLQSAALEKGKAAAKATDVYVHENPWQSVGIAAGVGLAIGLVVGLSINRR